MNDYGTCIFEGCNRPAKTRKHGLCGGHDSQMRAGRDLAPLRPQGQSELDLEGYRRCTKCGKVKEEEENFYRRNNGGYQSHCKVCCIKENRAATLRRRQEAHNAH